MKLDINIERIGNFIDKHIAGIELVEGEVPPFSSIEFSNNALCNRRCIFCPRVDKELFPNKNEHLSFSLFKKIIDELSTIDYSGRISFSGFCEPLLTKDLARYIYYGKERCPRMTIEISTNGDYLTEGRLKKLFETGLDNIRVSLYDGPHQDDGFNKLKEEFGLNDKQFIIRRRYLAAEESYGLTISNRAGAITLKNESLQLGPLKDPLKQPCYYPFYKMLIDYNGDVVICSNDWLKKVLVGNVERQTVFEIWAAERFSNIRRELIAGNRAFSPCNMCDVNGLYNGRIHFQRWVAYYETKEKGITKC